MTDRELLELAAKAAELRITWGEKYRVGDTEVDCTDLPYTMSDSPDESPRYWNPLEDDGDALRLAVKLDILGGSSEFRHFRAMERFAGQEHDDCRATRRAIVRAAAVIGGAS
jgi:hypothetical protein